jgi:hypothetical protein
VVVDVFGGAVVVVTEVGGAVVVVAVVFSGAVVVFGDAVVVLAVVFAGTVVDAGITVVDESTLSVDDEITVSWLTLAVAVTVAESSLFAPHPAINEPMRVMAATRVSLFLEFLTMVFPLN